MAFSTHDAVSTSPTNTFATLNPLDGQYQSYYDISEGNLKLTNSSTANTIDYANYLVSSIFFNMDNSFYFEFIMPDLGDSSGNYVGLFQRETIDYSLQYGRPHATSGTHNAVYMWSNSGQVVRINSSGSTTYSASLSISTTTIIGIFYKSTDQTVSFYNNGTLEESVDISSFNTTYPLRPMFHSYYGEIRVNFGQDHLFAGATLPSGAGSNTPDNGIGTFAFSVPSGAKALCTANLPDPAIDPNVDDLPEDNFKCTLYSGSTSAALDHDTGLKADLVWVKKRNNTERHLLVDSVRGGNSTSNFVLYPNLTTAQEYDNVNNNNWGTLTTSSTANSRFQVDANQGYANDAHNFVCWAWKAGGSPSSSDPYMVDNVSKSAANAFSGSYTITPTRASIGIKQGFSIVKYEGNSTDNATVPTGISNPAFFILKNISTATSNSISTLWVVGLKGVTSSNQVVYLNETFSLSSNYNGEGHTFNTNTIQFHEASGTEPFIRSNKSGDQYIMYCWTEIPGFSAFGSYTGNGSADGPFVYTGFKPAWVMIKCASDQGSTDQPYAGWVIYDDTRSVGTDNPVHSPMFANDTIVEGDRMGTLTSGQDLFIDILSNGFKIRTAGAIETNVESENYIFACFASMPFKYSATNAR